MHSIDDRIIITTPPKHTNMINSVRMRRHWVLVMFAIVLVINDYHELKRLSLDRALRLMHQHDPSTMEMSTINDDGGAMTSMEGGKDQQTPSNSLLFAEACYKCFKKKTFFKKKFHHRPVYHHRPMYYVQPVYYHKPMHYKKKWGHGGGCGYCGKRK